MSVHEVDTEHVYHPVYNYIGNVMTYDYMIEKYGSYEDARWQHERDEQDDDTEQGNQDEREE